MKISKILHVRKKGPGRGRPRHNPKKLLSAHKKVHVALPKSQFSDETFMSAREKELVFRSWRIFLWSLLENYYKPIRLPDDRVVHLVPFTKFSKRLYHFLHQSCGFIAHTDRQGFYYTYFSSPKQINKFVEQFDRHKGNRAAEGPGGSGWLEFRSHKDLKNAMVDYITPIAYKYYDLPVMLRTIHGTWEVKTKGGI